MWPTARAASPTSTASEIDSFDRLFLATKEQYVATGIDVHYETTVEAIDPKSRTLTVCGRGARRPTTAW